jgi:hypothetical protein
MELISGPVIFYKMWGKFSNKHKISYRIIIYYWKFNVTIIMSGAITKIQNLKIWKPAGSPVMQAKTFSTNSNSRRTHWKLEISGTILRDIEFFSKKCDEKKFTLKSHRDGFRKNNFPVETHAYYQNFISRDSLNNNNCWLNCHFPAKC